MIGWQWARLVDCTQGRLFTQTMSFGGHYKRPRTENYQPQLRDFTYHPGQLIPGEYGLQQGQGVGQRSGPMGPGHPAGGVANPLGLGGQILGPQLQSLPPFGPSMPDHGQRQAISVGLGAASDGSMPVVKLRGLPFDTEVGEINRFLDIETVDVVLVRRQGRFSGEAYVVLPGMAQVEHALGKHKHYMGKRYVEVLPAVREDYYRAVSSHASDPDLGAGHRNSLLSSAPPTSRYGHLPGGWTQARAAPTVNKGEAAEVSGNSEGRESKAPSLPLTSILRLRGLPFNASQEEVSQWFNAINLSKRVEPAAVHLVLAYDGRPTGSAFVEFSGPADAQLAMVRDRETMGSRYVELFQSSPQEIEMAMGGGL